jgi:hypothetical protein
LKRSRHWILLAILAALASCGEKEKPQASSGRGAADGGGKTARSADRELHGEGEEEDPVVVLKRTFEDALVTPDAAARQKALEQVAWDGIDVDPELARRAFEKLEPDSEARRKLSAHFAMRLAESNPDEALEWALALPEEGERGEALGRIAVVISDKDPERAGRLIAEHVPEGKTRDRAVVQVLQRWSQADPAAAVEWAGDFSAGAARSAGLKVSLAAWLEKDAPAAAAWVGARSEESLRADCLVAVAESLRGAAAEVRTQRLAAFGDAEFRRKVENLLAQPPR